MYGCGKALKCFGYLSLLSHYLRELNNNLTAIVLSHSHGFLGVAPILKLTVSPYYWSGAMSKFFMLVFVVVVVVFSLGIVEVPNFSAPKNPERLPLWSSPQPETVWRPQLEQPSTWILPQKEKPAYGWKPSADPRSWFQKTRLDEQPTQQPYHTPRPRHFNY